MTSFARSTYRAARKVGYPALSALSIAKTYDAWTDAENAGLVKLEAKPDDTYEPCDDQDRKAYERDGAWGVIGYCRDENGKWHHADSVWGFVGYQDVLSPVENCYVADIMAATLASLPDPAAMI